MVDSLKFDLKTVDPIIDPTTGSGDVYLFSQAFGQEGRPYVFMVEDPPHKTRPKHYHHADVLYVYIKGEHHIEGEGTYRAGDLRWTKAGYAYGPETTGPDGGAWWVISYSDPIPVEVDDQAAKEVELPQTSAGELPHFARPYDWAAIDHAVQTLGGAIIEGLLNKTEIATLNADIDRYLEHHTSDAEPDSGSDIYDKFLGHRTLRLHGLIEKVPTSAGLIGQPEIVEWAERVIGPNANSVLLNAGELIQIQPGEPAQFPHRDTDSWPELPDKEHPFLVNAIVALDEFTKENGATHVATESWSWDVGRRANSDEYARAVMDPGDALLFRGDVLHGGGENRSKRRRRALSLSYCAGWIRPVENSYLNLSKDTVRELPEKLRGILGYSSHNSTSKNGGLIGLYEGGDPSKALEKD